MIVILVRDIHDFYPALPSVFALTTALSTRPPVITNVVFDNKTCAVQLVSFLKVPLVPLTLNVPSWTVLHFKETDLDSRLLKVWWHEESWTIEGNVSENTLYTTTKIS